MRVCTHNRPKIDINIGYPPFYRTIKVTFRDRNLQKMQKAAFWFGQALELKLKENVLGPEPPPVGRVRNLYISNVLVKIPKKQSLAKTKEYIKGVQRSFNSIKEFSTVKLNIDVDNY